MLRMRHSRAWLMGFAAVAAGLGSLVACVGDSPVTGPDATADASNDVGNVKDSPTTDGPTGCAARTADDTAGVFVAQSGSDVNSCGTRANPCKTITYALAAAKATTTKTTIYVAAAPATDAGPGAYQESITLDSPITIEGGWSDTGGNWNPICDATTSTAVVVQGVTNTTIHATFTGAATLRDIKVISKPAPDPSESLYGIFAAGSTTNLTLDQVVVDVGPGGVGVDGTAGTMGANATDAGCAGGNGANGGTGPAGTGAVAGSFSASGYTPTNGGDAGTGITGGNGTAGGSGACATCQVFTGSCPNLCTTGNATRCGTNGLAGCGGNGGGGGSYGTGGGASVAVYVWDAHVTVFGGTFSTSNGGNGGNGGPGADGGAGTIGAAGSSASCATQLSNPACFLNSCSGTFVSGTTLSGGSAGGTGGAGGVGGQGGGGSGGPTFAIVQGGDGGVALNGNPKLAHGDGGAGGANGGAGGASGDRWP